MSEEPDLEYTPVPERTTRLPRRARKVSPRSQCSICGYFIADFAMERHKQAHQRQQQKKRERQPALRKADLRDQVAALRAENDRLREAYDLLKDECGPDLMELYATNLDEGLGQKSAQGQRFRQIAAAARQAAALLEAEPPGQLRGAGSFEETEPRQDG